MKNKLNKKGFTLVELLAVIVVLAIIMVIAFTSVSNAINTARANSFASSVKMLTKDVKNRMVQKDLEASPTILCDDNTTNAAVTPYCYNVYEYSQGDYLMKVNTNTSGGYIITITGIGKFSNIVGTAANLGTSYAASSTDATVATRLKTNGTLTAKQASSDTSENDKTGDGSDLSTTSLIKTDETE